MSEVAASTPDHNLNEASVSSWDKRCARSAISQWKQTGLLSAPVLYSSGACIFDETTMSCDAFLLEKGVVGFQHKQVTREKSGIFALCLPGRLLGRSPGLVADPYAHSAVALTDCVVYRIDREQMLAVLRKGGDLALFVVRQYLQNLLSAHARATQSTVRCTKARLRCLLLELASVLDEHSAAGFIHLPLKDKELAGILGISPQQFSVIKKEMEAEKVIASSGQRNRLALRNGRDKVQFFRVYRYKQISCGASSV
jgi:CRP-like cAMP-binding protein